MLIAHRQSSLMFIKGECTGNAAASPDWRSAVYQRKETDKALINHLIASRYVLSELACSLACLRLTNCESYNYQNEGKQHVCELNNQTASIARQDLMPRKGFSYYGPAMSPCQSLFCQNGGTCQATLTSTGAQSFCLCKQRYQGDVCQHLRGFRFTNKSSGHHVRVNFKGTIDITALSVCLRLKISETNHGLSTPLSYVTDDTALVLQLYSNGSVRISIKDQSREFSFVSLMDDAWHHLCVTWEDIYGNLTLYIDGLLVGQKDFAAGVNIASSGNFAIGQNQNATSKRFILDESYLGDIADVNIWSYVLSESVVAEQSRECFGQVGDLLSWTAFSTSRFQISVRTDGIPAMCKGFDSSATFDIEITKRSNKNYVLVQLSSFSALSAFTISLFVSFTDPGPKTYFNYYRPRSFNEIFIYERNNHFIVNLRQNIRQHVFVIPNDGMWHHVAVTWENMNGSYEIFVDGQSWATGNGLIAGNTIKSSGIVVVGNDKDGSGFESRDAFVGSISRLNVWDHVLPRDTIALLSRRCGHEVGEILSWNGVKVGEFYGEVYVREPSSCQRYV